jgi:flagellar motility protein MotE (MotC chaperone)
MNLLSEKRTYSAILILICCLLVSKGWMLSFFTERENGSTCLAAPASGEAAPISGPASANEESCRNRLAGLFQDVQQEKDRLQQKVGGLDEREGRLDLYQKELDDRIEQLKLVRAEIEKMYQSLEQGQQDRAGKLVKIYQSMEAESAAREIEIMDDEIGSWLLEKINPRQSAQILAAMNPQKASRLAVRLCRKPPASKN